MLEILHFFLGSEAISLKVRYIGYRDDHEAETLFMFLRHVKPLQRDHKFVYLYLVCTVERDV